MKLDRIDFEIIEALQNNSRLSNKELAAKIGLAPSSCLQRVKTLKNEKVIRGFYAEISTEHMGIGLQAFIAVKLVKHSRNAFKTLYAHILSLPEVLALFHVSGLNDLQVHVAIRDIGHLRDLIVDKFATRPEVDRCETSVIYDSHRNAKLPRYVLPQ